MKESTLLEIYCPMLAIQFWFIFYTLNRLRRHWNDGRERKYGQNTATLYIKYLLVWGMVGLSSIQVMVSYVSEEDTVDISIIKMILFSSSILSWIMSWVMLRLEITLRLAMKWIGHRIFWPINLAIYSVLLALELLNHEGSILYLIMNFHVIIDLVGLTLAFVLTIFAIFKPNEFSKDKDDFSAHLRARISTAIRYSTPEDRGLAGAVQVSIKNYKIKVENNKQVVLYNITVKIKGEVRKIRRTYHEFDKLYKAIRRSFPLEVFPYMSFPSFPVFTGTNLTIEQKTNALNEFLTGLCCPEFMLPDTLDFLNIKGQFREKLLEEHESMLEAEKAVAIAETDENVYADRDSFSTDNRISLFEKSSKLHSHLHSFFQVKLCVNESPTYKTDYILTWLIPNSSEHFETVKKFKDFAALNNLLKKVLAPAELPKFPEKSYVQNLRKTDSQGVEIRRRKLEKYLSHLLNDPGFICQELLDFIGCKLDLGSIIEKNCGSEYEMSAPIGWEGELEGNKSYIIYTMSFAKYYEGEKVAEWSVKRGFKDFEYMDQFLFKRTRSPMFGLYLAVFKQKVGDWPKLPMKHPSTISNPAEIEVCRGEIQNYMEELCSVSQIATAYAFKCFIDDPDNKF